MAGNYRAFISYSHRDSGFAGRIHAQLEAWRVDKDLIGRDTSAGPVPDSLRPIFRDREDLSGGGQLSDAIRETLSNSRFLLVLCSPESARSNYVNEEVRLFKATGRADRIIPLIIAGEPGDPARECFPPALTHQVDAHGKVLEDPEEPLAADAREQGDGRRRALAKVVAGLLCVPFDEIARRAEKAQRRRTRILAAVTATMFLLSLAAGGFAWLSENRRVAAERNYHAALNAADSLLGEVGEELINIEGVQLDTTKRVIQRAGAVLDELEKSLPRARELKVSKIGALAVFAKALGAKGDKSAAVDTYRRAETLAQDLADIESDEETGILLAMTRWRLGMALASTGQTDPAIVKLRAALSTFSKDQDPFADSPQMQTEILSAMTFLSLLLSNEGQLEEAAAHADNASALAAALLAGDPDSGRYRVLHATSEIAQATLLRKQGNTRAALALLTGTEGRLDTALEARPDFPQLRGLLSSVQADLAGLHDRLGDSQAADAARQRSAAMVRRLAQADVENREMQRQHADSLAVQAEALATKGELAGASALFDRSLKMLDTMAAEAPRDASVQSSLDLVLSRAADSLNRGQLSSAAETAARRLLARREAELKLTPDDPDRMQSAALARYQLAVALEGTGALDEALTVRLRMLDTEQRLATRGMDNRAARAETHRAIGLLAWRLSRRAEAIPHYERQNELLLALAAEAPDDTSVRITLGQGLLNLGELRVLTGDAAGALEAFQRSLELRRKLVDSGMQSAQQLIDLAWSEARLAQFGVTPRKRWQEVERLLTMADASSPLGDLEDELLTVARIALSGTTPGSGATWHPAATLDNYNR